MNERQCRSLGLAATLGLLILGMTGSALAASVGPSTPNSASGTNWVAGGGSSLQSDISSSDNSRVSYNAATQDHLRLTNFGFSIPSDATVNGIVVTREGYADQGNEGRRQFQIALTKNGSTASGLWKVDQQLPRYAAGEDVVDIGTSTDLWAASWTPAEVNSSSFGLLITDNDTSAYQLYFDHIQVTVYYTAAPSSGTDLQSYRWADSNEGALQAENVPETGAIVNQPMHLRVGIRSLGASWTTHRLGLQYANNASFTGAAIVTTASANVQMWDDTDHSDGDAVSGTKLLSGTGADGEYHESNVTSGETKSADTIYEEDFAVNAIAAGTWYLRVVEVDSSGVYVGLLDNYSQTIQMTATTGSVKQTGFAWAADANVDQAGLTWQGNDTAITATTGSIYILAAQTAFDANFANSDDWVLQYQEDYDTATPGAWTDAGGGGVWTTVTAPPGLYDMVNNDTIATTSYSQTGEAGYTAAGGEFSNDNNGVRAGSTSGTYVEYWYAITADSTASGHSYRFRVVRSGANFTYLVFATCTVPSQEQVSYRWLGENEGALAAENTKTDVVEDTSVHLRVALRSNHANWNGKYVALQVDDNTGFTTPTLLTTSSSEFKMWDDPDHTDGDSVSVKQLSGSPSSGKYHESNATSSQDFASNTLYEVDFTVQVNYAPPAGTDDVWYFRVVEVDASGTLIGPLTQYSETIELWASESTNTQASFNWAADAATLSWNGIDQPLQFTASSKYVLAVQVERTSATGSTSWTWSLQYQEDPDGTPGPWTDVTYTSQHWRMANNTETYNSHNNGDAVTTGQFVCGTGAGTAVNGEYSNDSNGVNYAWSSGNAYTEFWYALQAEATSASKKFRFRIIRNIIGPASILYYNDYPTAVTISKQQTAYRWSDDGEAALAAENSAPTVATNQYLHLRVGVKQQGSDWGSHYLALQYDDNSSFTSPTLVTTATPNTEMWDDADNSDGDAVSGSKLLSGTPSDGEYHESNVTSAETKTADTLYEEDFAVRFTTADMYYLRVVLVDASGVYQSTLDDYQQTIQVEVVDPADDQAAYNWAPEAAVTAANLVWSGENTALSFTTGNTYVLAMQVHHTSASSSDYDWVLQYQKDPDGSPGAWTSVTTSSSDWQIDAAPTGPTDIANEGAVGTANFDISSPGGTAVAGELSLDSNGATHLLSGNPVYTEYWYAVTPQAAAAGFKYRFRITNSGSTLGLSYSSYAIAAQASQEQLSCRWGDTDNVAVAAKNASYTAATGDYMHLRIGFRSNNGAWNGHRLGLEFADNPSFTGAVVMNESAGNLRLWNDTDHTDATQVTGTKLLEPPGVTYGYWHEADNAQASENFAADTIYEEDFAVYAPTNGTYYVRLIEVDITGAKVANIDTYTQSIQLSVATPADDQSGFEWGLDTAAAPNWQGDSTALHFTPGTKYILGIQVWHKSASTSNFDWQLQYQEDPFVLTPGAWTTITAATAKWKTIAPSNVTKSNEDSVATGEFSQASPGSGGALAGEFSADSNGAQYSISTADRHTELWFCIQPDANTAGKQYRFRVTDSGSPSGITYSVYAFAYNVHIWDGSSSSAWTTTTNWAPETVPLASRLVRIPAASLYGTAPTVTGTTNILDELQVDENGVLTVASAGILRAGADMTLNGTLNLQAGSTLRMGSGTTLTGGANSTFQVSGTGQDPGGFATINAISGSYDVVLNRHVDVNYAHFYDLNANGVELAATSTTVIFDNVQFFTGAAGASYYLRVTGAAWDNSDFLGMGFDYVGGTKSGTIQITTGGTVLVNGYASGGSWLSGVTTSDGSVTWGPSAAEGLEAHARRSPGGNRITWSAQVERRTAGYRLLRRKTERYRGFLCEETRSAATGASRESFAGEWRKVADIPAQFPGSAPLAREYHYLDTAPPPDCEYAVQEVETSGSIGKTVRASERRAKR
jgi:hypothetical protein